MTADQYAEEWKQNSKFFAENGYYEWMSTHLLQAKTVVEIGCGPGLSTIALSKSGRKVISIEANQSLAHIAELNLTNSGVTCTLFLIDCVDQIGSNKAVQVEILVADIFDERIGSLLPKYKIDAMACWLIGAQPALIAAHVGKKLEDFTGPEMPEYRDMIHRRIYRLGNQILSAGGVCHIVDRMALNSWNQKDQMRVAIAEKHEDLSEGKYNATKDCIFLKRITASFEASKIQHIMPTGAKASAGIVLSSVAATRVLTGPENDG